MARAVPATCPNASSPEGLFLAVSHQPFSLHKPHGNLSQFVSQFSGELTKKKLGELHNFPAGAMSIGRLDEESEGLLLLPTDGKMSDLIRSRRIDKEYYAPVDGLIDEVAIAQIQVGVKIGIHRKKYITSSCVGRRLDLVPNLPSAPAKSATQINSERKLIGSVREVFSFRCSNW